MIVTRQRRRAFPWRRLLLPVVALALLAFALWWPPSHRAIAEGPLAPVWNATGSAFDRVAAPYHFAAQSRQIADENAQVAKLQAQIADLQTQAAAKDKQIAQLRSSLDDAQAQSAAHPAVSAATSAPSAAAVADLAAVATADQRRTAQNWAAMDPDNAAKVIVKLPIAYVARVLAVMAPDAVGPILDALPPSYAAALTQEHPELRR